MEKKELKKGVDFTGMVAAFWCHDGAGNFFFSQRSTNCRNNHGKWECGGGGLKFGESPQDALTREIREELGCTTFTIDETLPVLSNYFTSENGKEHWIVFPFIVRVRREDITIREPDMVSDSGWFTLDNPPDPLDYGSAKELREHKAYFLTYK